MALLVWFPWRDLQVFIGYSRNCIATLLPTYLLFSNGTSDDWQTTNRLQTVHHHRTFDLNSLIVDHNLKARDFMFFIKQQHVLGMDNQQPAAPRERCICREF